MIVFDSPQRKVFFTLGKHWVRSNKMFHMGTSRKTLDRWNNVKILRIRFEGTPAPHDSKWLIFKVITELDSRKWDKVKLGHHKSHGSYQESVISLGQTILNSRKLLVNFQSPENFDYDNLCPFCVVFTKEWIWKSAVFTVQRSFFFHSASYFLLTIEFLSVTVNDH